MVIFLASFGIVSFMSELETTATSFCVRLNKRGKVILGVLSLGRINDFLFKDQIGRSSVDCATPILYQMRTCRLTARSRLLSACESLQQYTARAL